MRGLHSACTGRATTARQCAAVSSLYQALTLQRSGRANAMLAVCCCHHPSLLPPTRLPPDAQAAAPNNVVVCEVTYKTVQDDLEAGKVTISASGTGPQVRGATVDASGPSTVEMTATPELSVAAVSTATLNSDKLTYNAVGERLCGVGGAAHRTALGAGVQPAAVQLGPFGRVNSNFAACSLLARCNLLASKHCATWCSRRSPTGMQPATQDLLTTYPHCPPTPLPRVNDKPCRRYDHLHP